MQKLALTFSFASRHLPTPSQLTSVLPITDLIVATNMGGTVEEIDYLREYAAYYQVPIFIHDHLFQGSDSSRSYTITRLSEEIKHLKWKPEDVWVLWLEPCFMLEVSDRFHKGLLNRDLLSVPMIIDGKHLTDKILFRLSTTLTWHGPYLETPMWEAAEVTTGWTDYLRLIHIGKGDAWKLEQYSKYNQYACVHENYIRQRDHSFKWIFLTAQYYTKTASLVTNDAEIHYMEEKAKSYLNQVIRSAYAHVEHRLYALWNIYLILQTQQKPWAEVQDVLLKIYNLAPERSEAIKQVLHHYILQEEWNIAYLFSKFAITTYIRKFSEDPDLELQEWHRYVKGHLPHMEEPIVTNTTKETTWSQHLEACLKILAHHPQEGEPVLEIIHHYLYTKEWQMAYLFTKMAKEVYHRQTPPPGKDPGLYRWKFLFYHYLTSYYSGKRRGMLAAYGELMGLLKLYPEYFSKQEKGLIRKYAPLYLHWNSRFDRLHLPFIHSSLIPNSLLQNTVPSMSESALQQAKNL